MSKALKRLTNYFTLYIYLIRSNRSNEHFRQNYLYKSCSDSIYPPVTILTEIYRQRYLYKRPSKLINLGSTTRSLLIAAALDCYSGLYDCRYYLPPYLKPDGGGSLLTKCLLLKTACVVYCSVTNSSLVKQTALDDSPLRVGLMSKENFLALSV